MTTLPCIVSTGPALPGSASVRGRTPSATRRSYQPRPIVAPFALDPPRRRQPPSNLTPNESHLLGTGSRLLRAGSLDLDVLGSIESKWREPLVMEMSLGDGN